MSVPPSTPPTAAGRNVSRAFGFILLVMIIALVVGLVYELGFNRDTRENITQSQLFDLIKDGRVVSLVNEPDPNNNGIRTLVGIYRKPANDAPGAPEPRATFKVQVDLLLDPNLLNNIRLAGYSENIETVNNPDIIWPLIMNFLPIVLFVGLMYFLLRQARRRQGLN